MSQEITMQARPRCETSYQFAQEVGLSPLLAHIVACRLFKFEGDIQAIVKPHLKHISRPEQLKDADKACERITQAIVEKQHIALLTDYDVDGITSHVILYRSFIDYFHHPKTKLFSFIGHRMNDGYGVSEKLTDRILEHLPLPQLIITADCGSSDQARIQRLQQAGIDVIVTDHHAIPMEGIPKSAYAVINPTRPDCDYPDATIAGCMVSWLLMTYVRNQLIQNQYLKADTPKLGGLLSYVSLGTVADCVSLASSATNRAVVKAGLQLINRFDRPYWRAMQKLINYQGKTFDAETLAFQLGPRINARSRMSDPYAALHYLLAKTDKEAMDYLLVLDQDNQDRKYTEKKMVISAKKQAVELVKAGYSSLVIYLEDGHAGVQGIVASRLIQRFGRPSIVFCQSTNEAHITGSARSIPQLHMRDLLQQVADQYPEIFIKFGGHRGAAGLSILHSGFALFKQCFEEKVQQALDKQTLYPIIWTDGELSEDLLNLATVYELDQLQPYGREFEAPIFEGKFYVESVKVTNNPALHLRLTLQGKQQNYQAIWFRALEKEGQAWPVQTGQVIQCAYSLSCNDFRGNRSLQLRIQHAYPVPKTAENTPSAQS